jgi:putative aldouronate transport system permease protein
MAQNYSARFRGGTWSRVFDVCNYIFMALLGLITVGPFIYLLLGSLTETDYYRSVGVTLNPAHWSLDTYAILLGSSSRIYRALQVSLFVTFVGTALSLVVTAALAYGLAQKGLPGRTFFRFMIFFTMLFSGGMVPFYLVVNAFMLTDTVWSLIIPFLVNAWYMFIMVKFFESLPQELSDAARIDGCSEFGTFVRIALPLSKPVLASIGLFYAVSYWNTWFWALLFIRDSRLQPLQLVLHGILSDLLLVLDPETAAEAAQQAAEMPPMEVLRMGAIVVTVLPIVLVYPFLQRYFVKGVMIGAIKG